MSRRVHANPSWRAGGSGRGSRRERRRLRCKNRTSFCWPRLIDCHSHKKEKKGRKGKKEKERTRERERRGKLKAKPRCSLTPLVVCGQPQLNPTTPATVANNCLQVLVVSTTSVHVCVWGEVGGGEVCLINSLLLS